MPYALECIDLTRHFGNIPAVSGASLTASAGQLVALLGPSGCGKTTLLRLIAGFENPEQGQILIQGRPIASPTLMLPPEKRQVGMVFQEYALFQHLTVGQNVAFGLRDARAVKQARVSELLELVGLAGLEDRMPHELSGGQQQRVALARALAPMPAILLLDEPFSNLDAALRVQVRAEVRAILRSAGMTCIFVTHDQEEALSLADEVGIMLDGRIHQIAPPQQLYHQPVNQSVASFVGESNLLPGTAHDQTAMCALGSLPLQKAARGPVQVLVRPEAIQLHPVNGSPEVGRVVWYEFYGHDQRVGVQLPDGTPVVARLGPQACWTPGQRVRIEVASPVLAFPAPPTPSPSA